MAALLALFHARVNGVKGSQSIHAVPDVLLALAVALAFFGLCGAALTRLLLPAAWRPHAPLFALPVGAAASTLALTLLGLAHVPFDASLAIVLAAAAAGAVLARRADRPRAQPSTALEGSDPSARVTESTQEVDFVTQARRPDRIVLVLVPACLALLVGAISLVPSFRAGFATVPGQNGDAVLAVGTANFLQHAPPMSVRPELPLDSVPLQWRSKLPIYYGLAAISRLAGQDPINAFPTVSAVVLAMFAIGLFLVALLALRAPPLVALLAMFLVPLDRIVTHVAIHPYFNQLWAMFALPFVLLLGWRFLRAPDRRTLALALLFTALALFTYPLLLPFPVVFLAAAGWRERHRARGWLGELRMPRWGWALLALAAIPVAAVLVRGFVEKVVPAIQALAPGGDLSGWAGGPVLPYLPFERFLGTGAGPLALLVLVGAWLALRRPRTSFAFGLAVMLAGALLAAAYVRWRRQGELFWFKDLAFAGPMIVLLAIVGLARLRASRLWRLASGAAIVALALSLSHGTQAEIGATFEQVPRDMLDLRAWDRQIPTTQDIRIDVPKSGWQMWGWYLMPRHRVSASRPLGGFFPHPPFGLNADLSLVLNGEKLPPDVYGPPLRRNRIYSIYRLRPNDQPDTSTQRLVSDIKKITFF